MAKTRTIDMLKGPLTGNIIKFALPIALSSMLQQLFNSADTAVVGRFADANALGAVGTNGEIVGLFVFLSSGLSVGVNVFVAHLIGSNHKEKIQSAIHTSVAIALVFGFFICLLGQFLARPLLSAINVSPLILDNAVLYLRLYFLSYPFLLLYDFASSILRAKGDSRRPFLALTLSGIMNVVLNLLFVIVFKMSVAGVAISTVISTFISCLLVFIWLFTEEETFRLHIKKIKFNAEDTKKILLIGIPAALQGAVLCFANIFIQSAVNKFGPKETAGNSIAVNFEYFAYYMVTAFGQAATTFTSQNYGAGNIKRCSKVFFTSLLWGFIFTSLMTFPLTFFRSQVSSIFTSDSEAILFSCKRILVILLFEPICNLYEIPAGVMRGFGKSALPSLITLLGVGVTRIIWTLFIFPLINTPESLFVALTGSWIITLTAMLISYAITKKKINSENLKKELKK